MKKITLISVARRGIGKENHKLILLVFKKNKQSWIFLYLDLFIIFQGLFIYILLIKSLNCLTVKLWSFSPLLYEKFSGTFLNFLFFL